MIKEDISDKEIELSVYHEFEYLRKMAELDPTTVTYIIQSIQITKRNSPLIYFLLNIVELLPAEKISQLLDKIYIEKWISLGIIILISFIAAAIVTVWIKKSIFNVLHISKA